MNKYLKAYEFNKAQIIKYIKTKLKTLNSKDNNYHLYQDIMDLINYNSIWKEDKYKDIIKYIENWDKKIYYFLKESKKLWDWGIGRES